MNNLPKPEISPNFTIEDIHKIREWRMISIDSQPSKS